MALLLPAIPQAHFALWGAETAGLGLPLNYLPTTVWMCTRPHWQWPWPSPEVKQAVKAAGNSRKKVESNSAPRSRFHVPRPLGPETAGPGSVGLRDTLP